MASIIKIENLTKQYGKKQVLKNLNLEIHKGEIFGIIGMSGSGKTTLLNTLIGFLEPEEGDIQYLCNKSKGFKSVFKNSMDVRKKFGFSTQEPSFYPKLTIAENLDHFGALYNLSKNVRKNNMNELLKLIELEDDKDKLAQELSGGMAKRLSIACSLIHNPDVLILDEPTANLDPVLRSETWDLIKSIHKVGTTVIVASHLLDELEPVCDRIAILHNHSIIELGTPDQLKGKYSKEEEIRIKASGKHDQIEKTLKRTAYVKSSKRKDGYLIFYTQRPTKTLYQLLRLVDRLKENIISLEVSKPSLKEVFESIYR